MVRSWEVFVRARLYFYSHDICIVRSLEEYGLEEAETGADREGEGRGWRQEHGEVDEEGLAKGKTAIRVNGRLEWETGRNRLLGFGDIWIVRVSPGVHSGWLGWRGVWNAVSMMVSTGCCEDIF